MALFDFTFVIIPLASLIIQYKQSIILMEQFVDPLFLTFFLASNTSNRTARSLDLVTAIKVHGSPFRTLLLFLSETLRAENNR